VGSRPEDGLADVREALARHQSMEWTIRCGWLLVIGMRACADLAGQARARRDEPPTQAALDAAGDLARLGGPDERYPVHRPSRSWRRFRPRGAPGTPNAAASPAERARRVGRRREAWGHLGCPHRAAYAAWRHAEARLLAGERPARSPARFDSGSSADRHVPLQTAIHALADRARIPLDTAASAEAEPSEAAVPYGLTEREVLVLRLLVAGRSNGRSAQSYSSAERPQAST
jgi:hypothetical protein